MIIKFFGVGSAINSRYNFTSLGINNNILIDVSTSVVHQYHKYNMNLNDLDIVIITHLHGDHYFGLPFLLLEYMLLKRDRPLKIFGPLGLKKNLLKLMELAYPESVPENLISPSKSEISVFNHENIIKEINTPTLKPIRVAHGSIDSYGLEIDELDTALFFSSDTQKFERLKDIFSRYTYCILDGTSLNRSLSGHMSYMDIVEFSRHYPHNWFFITHRSNYRRNSFKNRKNIIFPKDGEIFEICGKTKPIRITRAIKQN